MIFCWKNIIQESEVFHRNISISKGSYPKFYFQNMGTEFYSFCCCFLAAFHLHCEFKICDFGPDGTHPRKRMTRFRVLMYSKTRRARVRLTARTLRAYITGDGCWTPPSVADGFTAIVRKSLQFVAITGRTVLSDCLASPRKLNQLVSIIFAQRSDPADFICEIWSACTREESPA